MADFFVSFYNLKKYFIFLPLSVEICRKRLYNKNIHMYRHQQIIAVGEKMNTSRALKELRRELNIKQVDLAYALHVNVMTVNRWENGKNFPNRSTAMQLLDYAKKQGVSALCREALNDALFPKMEEVGIDDLKYAQLDRVNQLVNESTNAVFVCDTENYNLLYVNHRLCEITHQPAVRAVGKKCYQYIFNRDTPCENCHIKKMSGTDFFSTEYSSKISDNHYMIRSKFTTWNGLPAHIAYITDITQHHKTKAALTQSRELMTQACLNANMWAFTLDLNDNSALLAPPMQKYLDLPYRVENFIDVIFGTNIVSLKEQAKLENAVLQLKNGKSSVEAVLQATIRGKRKHWVRFRASLLKQTDGQKSHIAVCSAQMIDNEKAFESRIRYEHQQIIERRNDLMSYAVSNLSDNIVEESRKILDKSSATKNGMPYDKAIENAAQKIVPQSAKEHFINIHSREKLLAQFKDNAVQQFDYQLKQPDGKLVWVRGEMRLVYYPATNKVYLYEYCFTMHSRKILDGLMAGALQHEYEFFGALSFINGQMTKLDFDKNGNMKPMSYVSYDEETQKYADKYVAKESRKSFIEKTRLDVLAEYLKINPVKRFMFNAVDENGKASRKIVQYKWFDEQQKFCLISVMDIDKFNACIENIGIDD